MKSGFPLVSVIIPAYNAETFIGKTLESVLFQTYKNIEVLVVDDGSLDKTTEIIKSFAQKDNRIILLQQSNRGVAAARNLAIEKSKGEFIAPIDADDIWYPQNLEKQLKCMLEADPSVGLVYAWSRYIDEEGLPTGGRKLSTIEGEVYLDLIYGNFIGSASAPLIRRACFEKVGGYNCQLKEQNAQGCEDWDLYLRIAECYKYRVVPEFLIGYRQIVGSMSSNYQQMANSYFLVMKDAQRKNPLMPAIIFKLSRSNFYLYLAEKCRLNGQHGSTLFCLYKSLQLDPLMILNHQLWKQIFFSLIKFLAQPMTSLVWTNHSDWMEFKQRLGNKKHKLITISDFKKQVDKRQLASKNLYYMLRKRRWLRIKNTYLLNA